MENRHGLAVSVGISQATGTAERDKALELIDDYRGKCERRITLGADKAYDATQFAHDLRGRSVTPTIAIDGHLSKTGKRRKTASTSCRLRHEPALPQAYRRVVWLDQELRRSGQGHGGRPRAGGRHLHAGARRLQSGPPAQASGGAAKSVGSDGASSRRRAMTWPRRAPISCSMRSAANSPSIASWAPSTAPAMAMPSSLVWEGNDEMEPASGHGWAEMQDYGFARR